MSDEDVAPFHQLSGEVNGLLNDEDLQIAGSALSPDSAAELVVWENAWARQLEGAIGRAGGRVAQDRLDTET